ncbi:MAG TPA: hypothetical protein VGM88_19645 [Kofleriaceae bacterium]|jgi:hypothetical protein
MTSTRTVFYGFGAWVGQTTGITSCGWWAQDPNTLIPPHDPTKLIPTDIGMNPQDVRAGKIPAAAIQADDAPVNGGLTKVGPTFPTGSVVNGLWLEQAKYDALAAGIKPGRIPTGMLCRDYELKTVFYWAGALANRRFWGLYAEIVATSGVQAQCKIWAPGTSLQPDQQPQTTAWLNLATVAHPIEVGFTEIGTGASDPKSGALFLDAPTMTSLRINAPKLPPTLGYDWYPEAK